MTLPLKGLRLLIVEDEAMVAMLVEDIVVDLGGVVVDVVDTLERGLKVVDEMASSLDGAILDVNLGGTQVFPIADMLQERGVKFVFATGYGVSGVAQRHADRPILAKPFHRDALRDLLVANLV